jgi:DNA-binding transcriptional ArsR family regulator
MAYELTLVALSDPIRRQIVERLRQGPLRLGVLAAGLPVSRPAVSQHVKVLCDAGLLVATGAGARKDYALYPEALAQLRGWLDGLWTDALAAFVAAANEEARKP